MTPAHAAKMPKPPRPVFHTFNMPDPSVTTAGHGLTVIGTGPRVNRATSAHGIAWAATERGALAEVPSWWGDIRYGGVWAPDLARVGKRWVLYYAGPVNGLTNTSHCIGVAVSDSANGDFTPVHNRPLICPPAAATPRAIDPILDGKARRPRPAAIGAIDPSYANLDRKHYLVYKTDGRPSSIRIMRLNKNGLRPIGRSRQLLVNQHGVTENPVIFKRGSFYYMVTSEGDFAQCTYHTVVRRSRDLLSGWQDAPKRLLLSRGTTGICGPGGADVLRVKGRLTMYFHGWTCRPQPKACRPPFRHWDGREDAREPIRSLYAARLRWTRDGWPVRSVWVRGR